jgi:hypothetical protein
MAGRRPGLVTSNPALPLARLFVDELDGAQRGLPLRSVARVGEVVEGHFRRDREIDHQNVVPVSRS